MNKQRRGDKLDIMRARFILLPAITAVILLILTISGCNALKRGDLLKQTDEALYFSRIGFSSSDNALVNPTLTSDVFLEIKGFSNFFLLNVPYSTDTTNNLVISFDLIGKDSKAEYWDTSIPDWKPLISGVTQLDFNEGNLPVQHQLRVGRINPESGIVTDYIDFYIDVDKTFYPVVLNPHLPDVPAPLDLRIGFKDESGAIIPNMDSGSWNAGDSPQWDNWRMDIISAYPPPYRIANLPDYPEGFGVDAQPYYPENHQIFFNKGIYSDQFGYECRASEISYYYDPPALHISKSGNDAAAGTKTDPILSWGEAITRIQASPNVYYNIKIEASDTPYDVAPFNTISNALNPVSNTLSINGGYKPGFDDRYDGNWESRPESILFNSAQIAGGGELSPSYILQYDGVSNGFIMNKVRIEAAPNTLFSSALSIVNNAQPLLSDVTLIASQGAGDSSGLTLINSSPIVRGSRIVGKNGGTGKSVGIRMDNSNLQLESCFILSGDLTDSAYGISSSGAISSSIITWGGAILSGIITNDNFVETENFGIVASDTSLDINNTWIHAKKSSLKSVAVQSSHPAIGLDTNILGATFIADSSPSPIGLNITNSGVGNNFHMYNSVIITDKASAGSMGEALGINLQNMGFARISSNAIRVGTGDGADKTVGINLDGSNTLELHNNLIWSHQADDFLGIRSNLNVDNVPIRNNDFWDANGVAELELIPGSPNSIYNWQNASASISGNISLHVGVDTTYNYDTDDLDVGRITGTLYDDVVYGGEDLSGIAEYPEENPGDKRDKDWHPRNGYTGVGWSIGPYEYDNGAFPQVIYISTLGDDNHPLGSRQAPFASLTRAYDIARTAGQPRADVTEIRIALGSYDLTSPNMPDIDTAPDIRILGGYNVPSWSRNPDVYTTELHRDDGNTVLVFDSASIGPETLLDGFTLNDNSNIAGMTKTLEISGGARPKISNNVIAGGDSQNTYTVDITGGSSPRISENRIMGGTNSGSVGIHIEGQSNPKILANHIFGGTASNLDTGIYLDYSGADIFNNVIHAGEASSGGGSTYGINFRNNDNSGAANPVRVYNNTVFGGSGALNTTGIFSNDDNIFIYNNLLISGIPGTGNAYGISMQTDPPREVNSNLILSGPVAGNRHASIIMTNVYDDPANMETDLINTYARAASGNLMDGTNNPDIYFISYIPAMTGVGFLNENWRLSAAGPQNARTGGLNLSGFFNVDKSGNTRTAPWSIGAYEY